MLRKMRRRFVLAAMAAFGAVMLALAAGINVANYYLVAASQDRMLEGIYEYDRMENFIPTGTRPPISEMPWARGPEAEFTTRFFVVHCNQAGHIMVVTRDYIFSVTEELAKQYTEKILSGGRTRGYYKDYRYLVKRDEKKITIVFLNVTDSLHMRTTILLASAAAVIISLLAVLVLVLFFSGKAIRPFARSIERQKRFITDAGHELKTPLTSIATSADIAAMEHDGDEWIANIQKQTARLSRLVNELVALSRLDEEMPFPEKTVFSVSDAAWETAESFAASAKLKDMTFIQNIQEHLEMEGDRNAIQQMFSILLDNAVKYGSEKGEIRLSLHRKHGRVYMEVFNTCELEDTSELERVFDRFYRMDKSRSSRTGGTGIGLSMAQAIVEAHGGKIMVKSADGKSILFKVVI